MTTQYPNGIDNFPTHTDNTGEKILAAHLNNLQDAIRAVQVAIGTGFSGPNLASQISSVQTSMQAQINNLNYDVYNMTLQNYYAGIVTNKAGMQFDGFSDTSKADTTSAITTTALTAGQTTLLGISPVPAGFKVGQEVLIVDDVNYEFAMITAVAPNLTVTALKNSYKAGAVVSRSSSIIDAVNRKLNMGTVSLAGTASITTPVIVPTAAQSPNFNQQYRMYGIVRLSNGWLVVMLSMTSGSICWIASKDNGLNWAQLCYANTSWYGVAMTSIGNMVYTTFGNGGAQYLFKFDATVVTNADINASGSYRGTIDLQGTNLGFGCSITSYGANTLWAAWCTKTTTYANSFNIKAAVSTDGGGSWTVYGPLTTSNTANYDYTMPDIFMLPSGYPIILCQYAASTSTYGIYSIPYTGSAFSTAKVVYSTATYIQSWVKGAVDSNGNIKAFWQGYSASATTTYNIFTSSSVDGITWSASPTNLTNVTTSGYHQQHPWPTVDGNNNWHLYFDGFDPTVTTSAAQIRRMVFPAATQAWTGITTMTGNVNSNAEYPVVIGSTSSTGCNFTEALMFYMDRLANAVKFRGTWQTTINAPAKASALYSQRVTYPNTNKNTKVWHTRTVTASSTPRTAVASGASTLQLATVPSAITGTVFSDALQTSGAWTTQSGSFGFGTSGATSNGAAMITATNGKWKPQNGLPLTVQASFTMSANPQTVSVVLFVGSNQYYILNYTATGTLELKTTSGTVGTTATIMAPVGGAVYTLSLSYDWATGRLTGNFHTGSSICMPLASINTIFLSYGGPFAPGVSVGGPGVIVSNVTAIAPLPSFAVGDLIEVREGNNWERTTITAIGGTSGTTLTLSPALVNAYSTNAVVARVDETVQACLVASGATESFSPMTWQGSTLNVDGTIEDTYYYSTTTGGTDAVYKILQTRSSPGVTPQSARYGAVVGF